jgi:cupin 2 domain-containing protein
MIASSLFANIPDSIPKEILEDLVSTDTVRIERILSHGQTSPKTGWYDQEQHEWVMVLQGEGWLRFEQGNELVKLKPGMHINIPAHTKHRVDWTPAEQPTVWLVVYY